MEMTRLEHWDTRTLDEKIDSMLYERTALSRKPEELIKQELEQIQYTNTLTPDVVFRSSYFLDAIGLTDTYSEKDLETAILSNIQAFIKEMGSDLPFSTVKNELLLMQQIILSTCFFITEGYAVWSPLT